MKQAPVLKPDLLLAKSFEPGKWKGSYSLVGHTADVVNAVSTLVDVLGDRLISQFGLQCNLSELKSTACLAAYLHDWGKANEHFQGVVRANIKDAHPKRFLPDHPQIIRHEVASVLLAWEFREWLEQGEGDFLTALAAAGGHHLKLGGRSGKCTDELGEIRFSGDDRLFLYVLDVVDGKQQFNRHFKQLLKYGIKALGLPNNIKLSQKPSLSWSVKQIKEKRFQIADFLSLEWQPDSVFLAVIKSLLIAGDAIGSAIPNVNESISIKNWITENVQNTLDETKLQRVIDARLDAHQLRPFQIQLAQSKTRVTLARAGCGTGKTLGAYNWAKSFAIGRKLIFCYPTTGTSTEGFLDYVHDQLDSVLLHSRADVDLAMATTGEEEEAGEGNNESAIKLESFKAWGKESIVCTVDTVLGLLQCNRRPMYCFPAIANAAFVFDEVHCYDDRLFGALLRFLEVFKAPILLMSASFLPWQKEAITKAVGEPIEIISGSKEIEAQPRYRFNYEAQPDWSIVEHELSTGGKVLWVCNQVNTAIDVYKDAKARRLNAVLYHSRYRYQDRVQHHRDVVDGFKQDEPILAIATQVAEMSLDLSATLLVSQIADPAGLIQRLGRLNRRYCGHALDALFYPDDKVGFPYSKEELENGLRLIQSFEDEVCQRDLAQWLEDSDTFGQPDTKSVLLDGNWRTYPTSLGKEGFNITVLLEQDLATIKSLPAKEIPRYTIPIPAKNYQKWQKHKFYPIAPTEIWSYSPELGAYELKSREN
ncbi:CRISPR-associated helicase, Cas3 family [Stanieria cyanosphaera PCC 7437]|uniref:CRISPR-associated helicase, Cas3 family n=1 Tax=Stanieria cyanosphaera (strain ATCC 29371 / PCC 7437) TaxID=111780 RepID=K9XUL5_STAC7|nr:CRISPR-associated helicase/endonuclease Cas3 [Stanieria cyanosphaera]AFZ36228.1 CRISPR-associated helicase, Cas3 family [Stanieria cyanosphaera PCC 7437]